MSTTIFDRLEFNYNGDEITSLSSNAVSFMDTIPPLMSDWQYKDIADDNVGGYHKNPVANITTSLRVSSNSLVALLSSSSEEDLSGNTTITSAVQGTTSGITSLFTSMNSLSSSTGGSVGSAFLAHTNRISGVTPVGYDVDVHPYYSIALNVGQTLMYATRQSDGISNNAPMLGSFTSLFIGDQLETLSGEISTFYSTINSSITTSSNTDIETGETTVTRVSNLSNDIVSSMQNTIDTVNSLMEERMNHDINFYQKSKSVVDDMKVLKNYNDMGDTAKFLCQNYVGTDKLLSRLNS